MKQYHVSRWKQALLTVWLLPAVMLVGCSTEDGLAPSASTDTGEQHYVFAVTSDKPSSTITRNAMMNELSGAFGLLGAKYTGTWGNGQRLNYMYNEAVLGSGSDWLTSQGYIVPSKTTNMKFFAYYPYYSEAGLCDDNGDNIGSDPVVLIDSVYSYKDPSFTYKMPANAEDQEDLMYAISEEVHANNDGTLDTIRLHFHHLLTAVTIAAGESTESGVIRRATITDMFPMGTFSYDGTTLVSDENLAGPIDIYSDLDLTVGETGSGYVKADADKTFLIIPQHTVTEDAALKIEFVAGGKTYIFQKKLSDLSSVLTTPKNIQLNLSVNSLQKITVKATVMDWEHGANWDGAVSDQPALELSPLVIDWDATNNVQYIETGAGKYVQTTPEDGDFIPEEGQDDYQNEDEPEPSTPEP